MLNRKFGICLIVLSVFFLSVNESKGSCSSLKKYQLHKNFLKKNTSTPGQNDFSFLLDENDRDDDETSRARHKAGKSHAHFNFKPKFIKKCALILAASTNGLQNQASTGSCNCSFVKTPRHISYRSIRI